MLIFVLMIISCAAQANSMTAPPAQLELVQALAQKTSNAHIDDSAVSCVAQTNPVTVAPVQPKLVRAVAEMSSNANIDKSVAQKNCDLLVKNMVDDTKLRVLFPMAQAMDNALLNLPEAKRSRLKKLFSVVMRQSDIHDLWMAAEAKNQLTPALQKQFLDEEKTMPSADEIKQQFLGIVPDLEAQLVKSGFAYVITGNASPGFLELEITEQRPVDPNVPLTLAISTTGGVSDYKTMEGFFFAFLKDVLPACGSWNQRAAGGFLSIPSATLTKLFGPSTWK
jgi:hypothetical protein